MWYLSPPLSKVLAHENDKKFDLQGITEEQLFTTGFLILGLYFALSSFANLISWINFFSINHAPEYGFHRGSEPSYYSLTENLLTFAAGIGLVLTARIWARKLSSHDTRAKQPLSN